MSLPSPIPDNPLRWDGWRSYTSQNLYERLCLDFQSNPGADQIEENCRMLLVWWQKKLPLKNQPSNPMAQLLRSGMDDAPHSLAEARASLLDSAKRAEHDAWILSGLKEGAYAELGKFLNFALAHGSLSSHDEKNLMRVAEETGLTGEEAVRFIDNKLKERGLSREQPDSSPAAAPSAAAPGDSFAEFRKLLHMSRLCLDGEEMTDDQRDAMCNLGESLGLTGGQAEDLIDEYLDEMSGLPPLPAAPPARASQPSRPVPQSKPVGPAAKPAPSPKPAAEPAVQKRVAVVFEPLPREEEVRQFPAFASLIGMEMLLAPSGRFHLGSTAHDSAPNERPVSLVAVNCFYMSRFPVTNAQYEAFDPGHRIKRPDWADDNHPVVLVSSLDAAKFCTWLSNREKRACRLPTEAEWEYAARSGDGRIFPWGMALTGGDVANFADKNSPVAWRDPNIDDGYAQSSPVGAYPAGAGPFGHEDLAGNVWEWCRDYYAPYPETNTVERINPHGPPTGARRVLRGGSWKSRSTNLRSSTRAFNIPTFSSNDVGFRVVCECK
jgi:formylglycine-generating enzyme